MRRVNSLTWRRRVFTAAFLTLACALVFAAGAFADAGNPIKGTINAQATDNGDGTVTISVRGQWNWMSHGSDCNFDRAATGAAIAWSDRNGRNQGTNEVQRVALSGTGAAAGTFKLTFKNPAGTTGTSPLINSTDTAAQLDAKLENMTPQTIPAGGVSVTGGPGFPAGTPWNIEFTGALGELNVNSLASTAKSANLTVTITTPTAGVNGDPFNGFLLTNGTITSYLGTKNATTMPNAAKSNPADPMVHPVDLGMKVTPPGPYPGVQPPNSLLTQTYNDPTSNNPADYPSWKGGCGREPMSTTGILISQASKSGNTVSATTASANKLVEGDSGVQIFSMFNVGYNSPTAGGVDDNWVKVFDIGALGPNTFKYKTFLADGITPDNTGSGTFCNTTGTCKGNEVQQPWGSWGYQTGAGTNSKAFTHTYRKVLTTGLDAGKSGLPDRVCVNFYDVHGGGTTASTLQLVKAASEITVDGNGDNSVQTNDFNVNDGDNCITLIQPTLITLATDASVGNPIHDTATLSGIPAGTGGTLTFNAYGPRSLASTTPDCSGSVQFTADVTVNGPNDYPSGDFTPTAAGKYDWTVHYEAPANSTILDADSACGTPTTGAHKEVSTVTTQTPDIVTDARIGGNSTVLLSSLGPSDLSDSATISAGYNPTGTITFSLYRGSTCVDTGTNATLVATRQVSVSGNGTYSSGDSGIGGSAVTVTTQGLYRWAATYSGDGNNDPKTLACGGNHEDLKVINPAIRVTKTPHSQTIPLGGTAHWTITVRNASDETAINPGATLAAQRGGLTDLDLTLTGVHTTDAQAPNCVRTASNIANHTFATDPVRTGPNAGTATFAPGESYAYGCSRANIQLADLTNGVLTNVVVACGTALTTDDTCDNNQNTLDQRTGTVTPEDLTSLQNVTPNDTATLHGFTGTPDGDITFSLYRGDCVAANLVKAFDPITVNSSGTAGTTNTTDLITLLKAAFGANNFTTTDGTYKWQVSYTGDSGANGDISPGKCGAESFSIDNDSNFAN